MFKFIEKFEHFSMAVIERLENTKISLWAWIASFFAIIFMRVFLQIFSENSDFFNIKNFSFIFFHSISFFTFTFLFLSVFLHFVTGEKIEKITKLSLFAAFLILLPPILDILVSDGAGVKNVYSLFSQAQNLRFWEAVSIAVKTSSVAPFLGLYSLNPSSASINFGIRIEVLILMLGMSYYVFLKTKSSFKLLVGCLFFAPILFLICLVPYLLAKLTKINVFHNVSTLSPGFSWDYILFSCYLIFILGLGLIWFYRYNKEKALALIKNIRPFRTVQIFAVFFFGLYIGGITTINFKAFDYLVITTACTALISYWIAVVLFNDIADAKSDLINSPERPLASKKLNREETQSLATIFLIISFLASFAVSYVFFLLLLLRTGLAYLYSGEPFRIKRITFLSTFVLALAAFTTVLAGYLMVPGNLIKNFPIDVFLLILIAFTLGFNAKDIKDYAGDRVAGNYTIPVLFGLEIGKKIIGALSFCCFLLVPIMFYHNVFLLWPLSLGAGLASFFLIIRKKYNETPLFVLYFSYAIIATLIIF